jgi:hypothetical protein
MQNLSTDDFENVLELIVAFEWLVEMSQSQVLHQGWLFIRMTPSDQRCNYIRQVITIAEENTYLHVVFTNIVAGESFRVGLSLLLFGTLLPPTETGQSVTISGRSSP